MDLAYPLTETVEIDGKEYSSNLAFDNILRLIDMLSDKRMTDINQINTGLKMLIGTDLPEYSLREKEDIFYQLFQEILGVNIEESVPVDIEGNPMPNVNKHKRVYDLKQDAEYIYAAFVSTYQIDLFEVQGKLHWKKFKALFEALFPNSTFREIVDIRVSDLPTGKGTEKQRRSLIKLKEIYKLKDEP